MTIHSIVQGGAEIAIILLLLHACYTDIRWREISNKTVLLLLPFTLLLGSLSVAGPSLLLPLLIVLAGIPLSAVGWIGAGDIKLLSVLMIALSADQVGYLLLLVAIAGLPIALLSILITLLAKKGAQATVPYAVAISLGYLLCRYLLLADGSNEI